MLSNRAKRAIDLLTQGAEFVCRIERDPSTDLNHFKCRIMFDGRIIQGFGLSTFNELRDAGYLTNRKLRNIGRLLLQTKPGKYDKTSWRYANWTG